MLLRIAIGWQFLYEGLWKQSTRSTARPWSSAGYLRNAQGPFRDQFRSLAGDPDELSWLDADWVSDRWDRWRDDFVASYGLDESQVDRLDILLDGPADFRAKLDRLPAGVEFRGSLGRVIKFDAGRKRLIVDGKLHLTRVERERLLKLVTVVEDPPEAVEEANEWARAYRTAVEQVSARASRLSFRERLRASLIGDPDRAGHEFKAPGQKGEGEVVERRPGEIAMYRLQLERQQHHLAAADQDFEHDHAAKLAVPGFGTTARMRGALVGPVKALERELLAAADKLLTTRQRGQAAIVMPAGAVGRIDQLTIAALVGLGLLLISGLASRVAAISAAGLLMLFYLAAPPWPGVPPVPGPEHSLWVNKNLIEAFALLVIASVPSGRWFGLDALVPQFTLRIRSWLEKWRTPGAEAVVEADSGPADDGESAEPVDSDAELGPPEAP